MTTAPATSPPRRGPRTLLHRHWRLIAILLIGIGPFVPSILAMSDFLLADNALGFTPFALVAAIYLFWQTSHFDGTVRPRDIIVDLFFIVPLVFIAIFVLFITPGSMSWYFWLNRMDLAALAPWVAAVGFIFLGYQHVLRTWSAWAMLVLVWPYPAVWLQRQLSDLLTTITVWVADAVADLARLPFAPREGSRAFTTTHLPEGENFTLVIGQLCSGTSVTIGFLIVGTALALMSRGSVEARLRWLVAGTLLAFATNLVRVSALLVAASHYSREFAVETLHPILGLVLFILVVFSMMLLMPAFGLKFDPLPRGRQLSWEPGQRVTFPVKAVWAASVGFAFLIGSGVAQAQEFNFIGVGDGAPVVSVESERGIIPDVPGWDLYHDTQISWTDLFGRTSRGDVFSYWEPGVEVGARIGVQTIVTEDRQTLNRYTLEQCIDFHRRTLEARRAVDLGRGLTGYILHDTYHGVRGSVLYWVMPVNVDGAVRHARIALFGNEREGTNYPGLEMDGVRTSSASVRLGQLLETAMFGLPTGEDDPVRGQIDRDLTALAVNIIDLMLESGGTPAILAGVED
jgi:exosortase/archaeosortase family protein